MARRHVLLTISISLAALAALACAGVTPFAETPTTPEIIEPMPTSLPPAPVQPGAANPDEPLFISGDIPFTSPFFLNGIAEPFVLLEDEAGFVRRDLEFQFPVSGQVIGPAELSGDGLLRYSLALPAVPLGTPVDVDNDGEVDAGVQVFAVAYWSNTWGDPFLEERDGTGWSTAYASTIIDAERDNEIVGGTLVVWAPDSNQGFPTGFGDDGLLFTEDDPAGPIPAGYNIVDLDQEPFRVYKEAQPRIDLNEGEVAVNDYSDMSFEGAFDAMFEKASREYPFTAEKGVDWDALYAEFSARVRAARNDDDFYRAIRDFTYAIPDAHIGVSGNGDVFYEERGGGFGLILTELSDGRVIVTRVLPGTAGEGAGIQVGAEIIEWDGKSVGQALREVQPYFGPHSTEHHKRVEQAIFLTRVPPDSTVEVTFQNPGKDKTTVRMRATAEYDSLLQAIPGLSLDDLSLPLEGEVLDESGLGYVRITTFSEDYNLMARLWEHYIRDLIDNEVPGLIIDIRTNGGGNSGLALDFAGYFFDEEIILSWRSYYNDNLGAFERQFLPARVKPGPMRYDGAIAVLVSPYCVSACEGFAYALTQHDRAIVVGHYPTAGAYGEVGRGQYRLPGDLSLQFPTGRPETPDGDLLLEGVGVVPDITVPVTERSALGQVDAVLQTAVEALQDEIGW
jgi:C-terminal processing protease CtpA/Prc